MAFDLCPNIPYKYDYPALFRSLEKTSYDKQRATYADMCRQDLFFLLVFGLNQGFINGEGLSPEARYRHCKWWIDRINMVEDGPSSATLDVWSRETGKTTIITVGDTLQRVLRDPMQRIAFFSFNRAQAKKPLVQLKQFFESNIPLIEWFPDLFWENVRKSPRWSLDDGLVLKRPQPTRESTFEAWGLVDSMPTGAHYTHRVYDDIVTDKSVLTPGALQKTLDAYQLSHNLGTEHGTYRVLGTRYDFGDMYGHLETLVDAGDSEMLIRVHPAEEHRGSDTVYHLWEESTFHRKRIDMGSAQYSAQILCNPLDPTTQAFPSEKMRYYDALPESYKDWPTYCMIDPAGWETADRQAGGDDCAILVVAVDDTDQWWVLDSDIGRWKPDVLIDRIFQSFDKWHWTFLGIENEKYGQYLDFNLTNACRDRGVSLPSVTPMKTGNRSKDDRVMAIQPRYERGGIFFQVEQRMLQDQVKRYPGWRKRDGIDCLAYGHIYIKPRTARKRRGRGRRQPTVTGRNRRGGF